MMINLKKSVKNNNIFSTFANLNKILRVFGLSWIYQDGEKLKHTKLKDCIWKIILILTIFMVMNMCTFYMRFQYLESPFKITFVNSFQIFTILGYIQFIINIVFVFKYGRQSYLNYFSLFEYIDKILGMSYYITIKKSIRIMCLFFILIGILTLSAECASVAVGFGWKVLAIYCIDYLYLVVRMLSDLEMISNWTHMRYRLKSIGDLLEDYYCTAKNLPGVRKGVIFVKFSITPEDCRKQNDVDITKTVKPSSCNVVLSLGRCYLLLVEQCEFLNIMYGIRVLISCLIHLCDMIFLVNLLIRFIMGTMTTSNDAGCLPIMSALMRIITGVLMVICGINRCEQNYRETERIIRLIDHIVINKETTREIEEALKDLKSLILTRPINYHASNFFRLDYGTMVSLSSVVVTYSIILLQSIQ